jgi:pimeloyl-ACP methyl ester carboxylesterase
VLLKFLYLEQITFRIRRKVELLRKTVSGIMLTLLLMSMLSLAFEVGVAVDSHDPGFQTFSEPPATEWTQPYGGTSSDTARALVRTSDGGYAIAGYTNSYGAGQADAWLVKTDANGNTQWSKTYGGADADYANALVQTVDGGYALAGLTYSYGAGGTDFWLVKADSSGNLQWSKTYGGTKTDIANTLIQTADGGYALGGMTVSYCNGEADFWLVKTDANGNTQWTHAYGGTGYEQGQSLVQTVDGGYALAGWTDSYGAGADDFWLVKTDANGYAQWSKTYGGTWYDDAYALVQTVDGGYALAGNTIASVNSVQDFLLVKTDPAGNTQWTQTYGGAYDNGAFALVQTVDGGYALAGHTWMGPPLNTWDFWLVKTDSAGNAKWNKNFGGADTDIAYALVQTGDGGYALAGYTKSFGAGNSDFWLVKVGSGLPPPTYTLTITASIGGTTSPTPGSYQLGAGEVVTVRAFQYSEYQFDHWELDTVSVGSINPYSVTMNTAHTLRAVFGVSSSQRPIASFIYSPSPPYNPTEGEEIVFDASQSKGAVSFIWEFGDGQIIPTNDPIIKHSYQAAGTYNVRLKVANDFGTGGPTGRIVSVKKPPVVLVHGFQSGDTYSEEGIWRTMNQRLTDNGLTVLVSHYAWGAVTYSPIRTYAESLKWEVDRLRKKEEVNKVDIVAHSMGGLVARWYIEYGGGDRHVRKLIMLETPNKGCLLPGFTGLLKTALGTCIIAGVDPQCKAWADRISSSVDKIWWISDESKAELKLLRYAAYVCSNLANAIEIINYWPSYIDILAGLPYVNPRVIQNVHYVNIIGYLGIIPEVRNAFILNGVESKEFGGWNNMHDRLPESTEVIQEVIYILWDDPANCNSGTQEGRNPEIQSAPSISARIFQTEVKWHSVAISNTSAADFVLVWSGGVLNLTLVSPNGTVIDPSCGDPNVVYYDDSNVTMKGYAIRNPDSGIWNVSVFAANVSEQGEEYSLLTYLETNTSLFLELSKYVYESNEPLGIRANLTFCDQPGTGASINAAILKPDGLTENIMLCDDGLHGDDQVNDGLYANVFTNTSLWGTYRITVVANGSLNTEQFCREAFATAWVEQYPDLSLSESDINFSKETATEGETITINATIHNIGEADANNASILFYDGNPAIGTLIGECVINITVGEAETASIQWNATGGTHQINALISPYNGFLELNYTNNIANRTIEVSGHNINLLTITVSKTVVGQTYEMSINVTIENEGDFLENFNVTLYSNTTIIGKQPIGGMPNGTWTTITFTWNTTGFAKGNYTISAYAWPVLGETDTDDNRFTGGVVTVTVAGDLDGNFAVQLVDLVILAKAYGSKPGEPNWNPNADLDDNGIVGLTDLVALAKNYGKTDP